MTWQNRSKIGTVLFLMMIFCVVMLFGLPVMILDQNFGVVIILAGAIAFFVIGVVGFTTILLMKTRRSKT